MTQCNSFVPRLNEVEEGGVLDYPPSVCPSVRTSLLVR